MSFWRLVTRSLAFLLADQRGGPSGRGRGDGGADRGAGDRRFGAVHASQDARCPSGTGRVCRPAAGPFLSGPACRRSATATRRHDSPCSAGPRHRHERGRLAANQSRSRARCNDKFYAAGPGQNPFEGAANDGVVVSESVAKELRVAPGDEVVLRVEKSGVMPRDVPLVSDEDRTIAARLKVRAVAGDSAFGRFDLQANQAAPLNVFVPLTWLGEQVGQQDRANMLLAAGPESGTTRGAGECGCAQGLAVGRRGAGTSPLGAAERAGASQRANLHR